MLLRATIFLTALIKYIKSQGGAVPDNVTQVRYGRVNVNDQISYDLNDIFQSARSDQKEFKLNNKASRITSSDPFIIMEFQANCTNLNKAYRGDGVHAFSAICASNEFHEVRTKEADKKIQSTFRLLKVDKTLIKGNEYISFKCLNSEWSPELGVYALICESPPPDKESAGYVHVIMVSREGNDDSNRFLDHKVLIKSQRIDFTNKTKVKTVEFPKGSSFSSGTQFIAYDEPWIDQNGRVASKGNLFFLIWSLDANKKIYKEVKIVKFMDQKASSGLPLLGEMYKLVSIHQIGSKLIIAAYFNPEIYVQVVSCDLETSGEIALKNCVLLKSQFKTEIGQMEFWQSIDKKVKKVTTYIRKTKEIKICDFDDTPNAENFQINCALNYSRGVIVKDLAFGWFDDCQGEFCNTVYFDEKCENFIGVDEWKYEKSKDISGAEKLQLTLRNRFKSFGATGRVLDTRFYMTDDKYIVGFNDTRSEEAIIRASLLPAGENFYVTFFKDHANTHEFINITGYRVHKMIYQITARLAFPKFRGSLKQMYRVPLGRDYFNGNKIKFGLAAQPDIMAYSHIQYSSVGEIRLEGESTTNHRSFLVGKGTSSVITSNGKLLLAACYRALIKGKIGLDCRKVIEKSETIPNDEFVVGQFVSNTLHLVATSKGNVYGYWKRKGKKIESFFSFDKKISDVTFKVYKSFVLMAFITETNEIYIKYINQYLEEGGLEGIGNPITKALFENNQDNFKNPEQIKAGEFCPKGLRFSLIERPVLIIVNSCKEKDRRMIFFTVTETEYKFARNVFIRKVELDHENLLICPDLEMNFIAAIDTKHVYGIGLRTHNHFEDLGLHELNVTKIQGMICIGERAVGLAVTDSNDMLSIVTYYIGKMRDADNRVHSQQFLPGTGAKLIRMEASENEGLVFYNIMTDKSNGNYIIAVDIDGPNVFFKSMERQVAYETEILAGNGNENQNFDILVEFENTQVTGGVSCMNHSFEIKHQEYVVENISYFHGPFFSVRSKGPSGYISQQRISAPQEWVQSPDDLKVSSSNAIEHVNGRVYVLAQGKTESKILISDSKGEKISELNLGRRCEGLRMVGDLRDSTPKRVIGVTNCFVAYKPKSGEKLPPEVISHNRVPTIIEIDPTASGGPKLEQCNNAKDWPFYSLKNDIAYLGKVQIKPKGRILEQGEHDFLSVLVHETNHTMMFRWFRASQQAGDKEVNLNYFFREEGGKFIF